MPKYSVESYERWTVCVSYYEVEAASAAEAIAQCKRGDEAYDYHSPTGNHDEWIETIEVVDLATDEVVDPKEYEEPATQPAEPTEDWSERYWGKEDADAEQ